MKRQHKGKEFENLIAWIQKSVHNKAEIETNKRIKDVDTGMYRQIDITIKLADGPTEFLGIVEVRDRVSKVGVRYVEEVASKRRSVKADAVFLVSKSGFTKPATIKAENLGIRLLTFEEAKDGNWSSWLACRTFSVVYRKYDKPIIYFFDAVTGNVINPSKKFLESYTKDKNSKLVLNNDGKPLVSIPDIINKIINVCGEKPFEGLSLDGNRIRHKLLFYGKFSEPIFIESFDQSNRRVGKIGIEADFYLETIEYPMKLMKFKTHQTDSSIAELALSQVEILGAKYKIELLATGAGDYISAGSTVSLRTTPLKKGNKC